MIKELADLLKNYPGEAGHTRYFTHIINLVAKSIIRQFDIPKGKVDKALDDAEWELCELAEGINLEDLRMQGEQEDDDDDLDENNDGWIDEWEALDVADCEELDAAVHPVKLVLVKVSVDVFKSMLLLTWHWQLHKIAYSILHSTTILLPLWFQTLEQLELAAHKMPCNVSTRWNSTFNMLEFAIEYWVAIDDISSSKNVGLRQYELSEEKWGIAQQLCNTLKVHSSF